MFRIDFVGVRDRATCHVKTIGAQHRTSAHQFGGLSDITATFPRG
jgi:hypothetical protein